MLNLNYHPVARQRGGAHTGLVFVPHIHRIVALTERPRISFKKYIKISINYKKKYRLQNMEGQVTVAGR